MEDKSLADLAKLEKISHEELMELKSDIEKKKNDPPTVVSLLKVLQRKQITSDLLRSTKIGKTIANMAGGPADSDKGNEDERAIKSLSSGLVETWKQIHKQEKAKEAKEKKYEDTKSQVSTTTNGTQKA